MMKTKWKWVKCGSEGFNKIMSAIWSAALEEDREREEMV